MTDTLYLVAIVQICMLLTLANSFAVKNCHEGLFLHVIPETNEERCCIVVPVKRGEEFEICGKDGESDRVRPCPQGLYQPDDTSSASEVTCITPPQCIEGENVESEVCTDGFCRKECICNVKAGKCGRFYYQCEDIPTDCPENKVHPNCSCVIKPQESYTVGSLDVTSQETVTRSDLNNKDRSKARRKTEKKNKGKKRKGKRRLLMEKKKLKLEQDKKRIESEIDQVKMELKSTAHSQDKNTADNKRRKGKLSKGDRLQNGIFNLHEKKFQKELKLVKLKKNLLNSNYKTKRISV